MNVETYQALLQNNLVDTIDNIPLAEVIRGAWFQHHRAPTHQLRAVADYLRGGISSTVYQMNGMVLFNDLQDFLMNFSSRRKKNRRQ